MERARALAVVTDSDAANLATALHARGLRDDLRIVVRLFDPELAAQLERALGAYHSRSVSTLAAPAFAAAAIDREVVATIPVGHRRVVVVARVPVAAGLRGGRLHGGCGGGRGRGGPPGRRARPGACSRATTSPGDPTPDRPLAAGEELIVVAPRRSLAVALARGTAPGRVSRARSAGVRVGRGRRPGGGSASTR